MENLEQARPDHRHWDGLWQRVDSDSYIHNPRYPHDHDRKNRW